MKSTSVMSATGQTRRLLRLGALLGLVLSLSTATADAGVVPWLIDSLFGPVSRPCQAAYGSGYGYYGAGYGCPPAGGYAYSIPQRVTAQPVASAPCYGSPYYGNSYGSPCGAPCLPRLPNLLPGLLGGLFGCSPCSSPYGSPYGSPWGCSPCGYGGCPVTLPAGTASSGASTSGWKKSSSSPSTFVEGPQASGDLRIDTRTNRPAIDPDADPGEVIPKFQKPTTKTPAAKKPVDAAKPAAKPAAKKVPTALDDSAIGTVAHHVVPSRTRLARRLGSGHTPRLRSVVVARNVFDVQPSLRPELPGSTIAGR
jgi:hypothetical protein